ncbi:hypothetical protein ACMDCT_15720 [Halomonadaceae bacterium KBTZ08]
MSLGWTLAGAVLQGLHAFWALLFVVFSATSLGLADGKAPIHNAILDFSLKGVPAIPALTGFVLIIFYSMGASGRAYWLHLLPLATTVAYTVYVVVLNDV